MLSQAEKRIMALIGAGYALVIVLVITLGLVAISGMNILRAISRDLFEHPFTVNDASLEATETIAMIRDRMLLIALTDDPKQIEKLASEIPPLDKEVRDHLDTVKASFLGDMRRVAEAEILLKKWPEIRNREIDLSLHGSRVEAMRLITSVGAELFNRLDNDLDYVTAFTRQKAAAFVAKSERQAAIQINLTVWFLATLIMVISITGWLVARRVLFMVRRGEQMEKELLESEHKAVSAAYARSLIEASLDPLVTISPEGKITDVNQATEAATGKSRAELIGTDFADYFTDPDKASAGYRQVFAEGSVSDYPLSIRHQEGRIIDVLYNASIYRNDAGAVSGVFAAARDITARKKADEALITLKNDLENRVNARTAELESANKELEAFSYSVSHDLRTPLRAIDGFSLMLLEDYAEQLDDEGKRLLNVVRNNTSRMSHLIDDILHFSRVGRTEISFVETDVEQMVRDVLKELETVIAGRKLQINVVSLPKALCDRAMMHQVIENLLSNAIKFTGKKDDARIDIGGKIEDQKMIYWVKDNGAGFDMRYANKLFGVFQRLHGIDEFEGTGIGLAIVKRIINRHGGTVWAEGEVDHGATFYFSIPVSPQSQS